MVELVAMSLHCGEVCNLRTGNCKAVPDPPLYYVEEPNSKHQA